ncbi:MAG TPA: hypothetical protein VFW14_17290 [Gaiellales bacterium]|nr:hypothetical protein [Gaiellales bacterium]
MRRDDDRAMARMLADALDGGEPPTGELRAIVQVLEAAAAEARLDVPAQETEAALRAARPEPRTRRRVWPAAAVAVAVVAAAAALLLAGPFGSGPAADVQAQALAALGGRGDVLEVVERITPGPAGGFAPSTRTGWIDPTRGRAAWVQRAADGVVVDRTVVERGRITRYDPAMHTAAVAPSCAALATGCATAVDPIAVYRRALTRLAATETEAVTFRGRPAYRFALPMQRLADAARVAQIVTVDAHTLLPERIEWRVRRPGGRPHAAAVIDITKALVTPRELAPQDAFGVVLPPGTAVTELRAPGRPLRLTGTRRLTLAQARAVRPAVDWLGPRFAGHRLGAIELLRYGAGTALRLRYGPLLVWNYGPVIPPPLLGTVGAPVKQFPIGSRTARLYQTAPGGIAIEVDRPGGTVAITSARSGQAPAFSAAGRLRPITTR